MEGSDLKRHIVVLAALLILFGGIHLCTISANASDSQPPGYEERLKKAADFLKNVQFNAALNLCREAPIVAPNTYWLLSDNLLAQYALRDYYPEVSNAIMEELKRRGYCEDRYYSVLLGKPIPMPNKVMIPLVIEDRTPDYIIKADLRDESKYLVDWTRYADRLLFHSLSLAWKGDTEQAKEYFQYARELWTGEGLKDPSTVQSGLYETYKLSMLLLASKVLEAPLPFQEQLEQRIWSQQRDDGGIITHYNMTTLNPVGDANTETTSITIIAYLYEKPGLIDKFSRFLAKWTQTFPYNLITIVILSSFICLLLERVLRRHRKGELEPVNPSRILGGKARPATRIRRRFPELDKIFCRDEPVVATIRRILEISRDHLSVS